MRGKATDSPGKKYKINIILSKTTLLANNSVCLQGRIYFNKIEQCHVMVLRGNFIYTKSGNGMLIKIHQN